MTITLLSLAVTALSPRLAEVPELASMALMAVVLAGASVVLQKADDRAGRDPRDDRPRGH